MEDLIYTARHPRTPGMSEGPEDFGPFRMQVRGLACSRPGVMTASPGTIRDDCHTCWDRAPSPPPPPPPPATRPRRLGRPAGCARRPGSPGRPRAPAAMLSLSPPSALVPLPACPFPCPVHPIPLMLDTASKIYYDGAWHRLIYARGLRSEDDE